MVELHLPTLPKLPGLSLQRPRLVPLFAFIALLLGLSLFIVWSRLQVLNLEYDISSMESRIRAGQQEASRLRLEAASLRHPGRIEQVATTELGLRLPEPSQIINLR